MSHWLKVLKAPVTFSDALFNHYENILPIEIGDLELDIKSAMEPEMETEVMRKQTNENEVELQWPQTRNTEIVEASLSTFEKAIELPTDTDKIETEVVRDVKEVKLERPKVIEPASLEELIDLHLKCERTQPRYQPYNNRQRPLRNNSRFNLPVSNAQSSASVQLQRQFVQQQQQQIRMSNNLVSASVPRQAAQMQQQLQQQQLQQQQQQHQQLPRQAVQMQQQQQQQLLQQQQQQHQQLPRQAVQMQQQQQQQLQQQQQQHQQLPRQAVQMQQQQHQLQQQQQQLPQQVFQLQFSRHLTQLINVIRKQSWTMSLFHAENTVKEPTYLNVIKKPMDWKMVSHNIRNNVYRNRADFMEHAELIVSNAFTFYGPDHSTTRKATSVRDYLSSNMYLDKELARPYVKLEWQMSRCCKMQFKISSWLTNLVVMVLKKVKNIWPFLSTVNQGYDGTVARPMDMSTLLKNVQQHKYQGKESFMSDLVLIRDNFVKFKGPGPENNLAAHQIVTLSENFFNRYPLTFANAKQKLRNENHR